MSYKPTNVDKLRFGKHAGRRLNHLLYTLYIQICCWQLLTAGSQLLLGLDSLATNDHVSRSGIGKGTGTFKVVSGMCL